MIKLLLQRPEWTGLDQTGLDRASPTPHTATSRNVFTPGTATVFLFALTKILNKQPRLKYIAMIKYPQSLAASFWHLCGLKLLTTADSFNGVFTEALSVMMSLSCRCSYISKYFNISQYYHVLLRTPVSDTVLCCTWLFRSFPLW